MGALQLLQKSRKSHNYMFESKVNWFLVAGNEDINEGEIGFKLIHIMPSRTCVLTSHWSSNLCISASV